MMDRMRTWSWKRWLAIGVAGAAIAALAGPFVYIHFVQGNAPAPLALATPAASTSTTKATASTSQASAATDGTWSVHSDSIVGYRIKEILFGQSNVAVGRTSDITGSITVHGTTISAGTFTVDMSTVTSDESRRDGQFNGRIMETATYPIATFTLTQPVDLGSIPAAGVKRTLKATGQLTLHGVTKSVTFQVTGQYTGAAVQVVGSIPVTFADYGISNPSFGPVSTEDHGVLEFSLNFAHA